MGNNAPVNGSSPDQMYNKRFASLGPSSQFGSSSRPSPNAARPQLSKSMWDGSPGPNASHEIGAMARSSSYGPSASMPVPQLPTRGDAGKAARQRSSREKGSRWGFLKKMSMGKMKPDTPSPSPSGSPNPPRISRPQTSAGSFPSQYGSLSNRPGPDGPSSSVLPQIDLRLSTSGMLDALPSIPSATVAPPNPPNSPKPPPSNTLGPPSTSSNGLLTPPATQPRVKRRSFLPIDAPGSMSLNIPENSAFVTGVVVANDGEENSQGPDPTRGTTPSPVLNNEQYIRREEDRARDAYMRALRSVMAYLKDMNDLGTIQQSNPLSMYGASTQEEHGARSRRPTIVEREVSMASTGSTSLASDSSGQLRSSDSIAGLRSGTSSQTLSVATTDSTGSGEERKYKDDKGKRAGVIREIVVTERTYVKGLQELVDIYIKPAATPVNLLSGVGSTKDTVVPASERKVVFGGIDALFSFHHDSFLPALEVAAAPLMKPTPDLDSDGQLSSSVAKAVGNIFVKHAAFMKMYSSYINNFDSSVQRVKYWTSDKNAPGSSSPGNALSPSSSTAQLAGLGISMAMASAPNGISDNMASATGIPNLTTSQRKRIKTYLKRCRLNPRHTQLNLEGYLLLPVQRVPRYKLLLEELLRSTPPTYDYVDDPLDRALAEISSLATNMNEGKRESESRRKLVQWQTRIRGKFPSPLVQPHRRLIMDGPLMLTRVVRKAVVSFEAINAQGDASTVQVDCLAPELTPRPLIGILCNDLLVLCRDPSDGQDPASFVDLWAVLRMQTLPQPASIVHGNALRLVDNKAILYFDAPSPSDALNWYRAINLHIPASKA
ncbi:hypothetical protein NLJ89_g7086 [Agrocybe chaxingu]|uniref:DH domain-containing protein n=1 Tax=Agrocybe chaxingu TaxID=84603 RepID=A0A9W8JXZ7_9AGAR|nr:hypothetical protein NLJ89_g7086 [Agrocybe chaxingu]